MLQYNGIDADHSSIIILNNICGGSLQRSDRTGKTPLGPSFTSIGVAKLRAARVKMLS
jgi:hypothetical protein